MPLIEKEVVEKQSWLTKEEFLDVLGVVRVFPGAVSIKYAAYTGYKVAGVTGVVVANLGNFLAPAILFMLASTLYTRYKDLPSVKGAFNTVQLAVFAMIIAVAFQLINVGQLTQVRNLLIIIVCFILFMCVRIHPALVIIGAGLLGILLSR